MKKVIYSMVACVALFATSCSNDEIEVETVMNEEIATLKINVSTSNLYSTLDLTSSITNFLGTYDECIAVWSLLYDESGNFVDSINSYTNTIKTISQTFENIKTGTYTLVTVQTIVDSDSEDSASQSWELVDIDNLSTLCLIDKEDHYVYWYCCVGTATQTFVVDDDKTISVTPEAIGYIIDIDYENFEYSDYVRFSFSFRNKPNGYFLDPQLTESDRYYYDSYNEEGFVTSIYASYNSSGISSGGATIFSFLTGSVNYMFGLTDASQVYDSYYSMTCYPSTSEYYTFNVGAWYEAYAYYTGGSTVVETYMGENDDNFDEWYDNIGSSSSTSSTSSFSFDEPYTTWGATVTTVKSYMSDYTLYSEDTSDGCTLIYYGKDPVAEVDYLFSSSTTGLFESCVYFFSTDVTDEDLLSYLGDFEYLTAYEYSNYTVYLYYTSDYETIIYLWDLADYYGYYELDYYSYDYLSSSTEESRVAQLEKKVEDIIPQKTILPSQSFKVYDFGKKLAENPVNAKMINAKKAQ